VPHLWRHQQDAYDFLLPRGSGLLAMGMGSGKSCTAIALLEAWACARVLILCPKSVVQVWPGQFTKHADNDWHVLPLDTGTIPQRTKQMVETLKTIRDKPIAVVLNYDACAHSIAGPLKLVKWDGLVLDESHRIKQPSGKISRFVGQLASKVPHRLGLTGTPMPHSPLDIYAQFRAIWPGIYPRTNTAFKALYAVHGGFQNHQVVGYQNLDDLHQRMYRVTYRCRTEDVLDLPPYTDLERYCELDLATWRAYKELRDEMIAEIEQGIITADNALVKLLRLAQIANGFVRTDDDRTVMVGDEKATLLGEVLEELRAGYGDTQEPVVVFARFHTDLDTIHTVAQSIGLSTSELSGRRNELNHWCKSGSDVLVVQEQSGGVGIDLTRARYCVYFSQAWSLGNYEQSRARVHRPGQERPVTYIHLVARHTIDETIRKALERKAEVVRHVVDELRGIGSGHKRSTPSHSPERRDQGARRPAA